MLPADLKPHGVYSHFERILAGWLYLTSDGSYHRYQTLICADLVDSAGRVPNALDRGPSESRYWAASGHVYFSDLITDAMPDSIAVRVRGDTVEFVRNVYVLDRAAVQPRNLIPALICPAVRESLQVRSVGL